MMSKKVRLSKTLSSLASCWGQVLLHMLLERVDGLEREHLVGTPIDVRLGDCR